MKGFILISLLAIQVFSGISQNTDKPCIQENISKSELVVEAEVIGKQSFWDLQHKNIYTAFELEIATTIKGFTEKNPKLLLMGGNVDDILQIVSTSPKIKIGDRAIFMLQKITAKNKISSDTDGAYFFIDSKNSYIFLGDKSIKFESINGNQPNNESIDEIEKITIKKLKFKISPPVLKSLNSTHKITGFSPKTLTAGTETTLNIFGEGFGTAQGENSVWFTYADSPNHIFTNDEFIILSWSDTQIQMIVPTGAATGKINVEVDGTKAESSEILNVTYNVTQENNKPVYFINTNENGGYTFHLHSNINPYSGAKEVIEKSIKDWICATSVPWKIGNSLDVAQGMDDICSIQFGNLSGSGGETLGQASYFLKSMGYSEPNEYVLSEVDIVFSDTENWCFDNTKIKQQQIDFASVALHELGHAHLVGHVNDINNLMHSGLPNGEIRNIDLNNVLCGKYIIENSLAYKSAFFETIKISNSTPPIFSVKKDSLFSINEYSSYQWLLNGSRITNATNRKHVVATSGNYSLEVTDENNCWLLSESVNVIKSNPGSNDTVFSFSCPPNVMVDCAEDVPLPFNNYTDFNTSGGFASSSPSPIDESSFKWVGDISDKKSCPETIIRTYSIKNKNGEQISCEQLIIIDDNIKPVLIFSNKILKCTDERPETYKTKTQFESKDGNAANDNCELDWTTFSFLREGEDKENCPQTIVRWYEIYDMCGNRAEARENFIIKDSNPPIIICPADASFDAGIEGLQSLTGLVYSEIEKQIPTNNFGQFGIVAYDSCLLAKVTYKDGKTNFCPTKISRTFFAYDACGNFSSCMQQIELTQEITLLETHENDGANNLNTGKIDLTVFGGVAPYTFIWNTGETTEDIDSLGVGDYTVIVTDFNGCSAILSVKISSEVLKMNFDCPPQLTVLCKNDVNESVFVDYTEFIAAGGNAFSDCGIDTSTFIWAGDEILAGSDCVNINRTFNIKDSCGTTASCVQKITVKDKTSPILNCPDELVIVGNSKPDYYTDYSTFVSNGGYAVDSCEIVESSFKWISDLSDGKTNPETITRTYQIADFCENVASCEQKIKIYNNSGIYINCPPSIVITCSETKPNASLNLSEFIAEGGSAGSFIDFPLVNSSFQWEGDVQENDTCREIIFRTYSILNENGDYTSCLQQIIVKNETAPKLTCPPNIEIKGNENLIDAYNSLNDFILAGGSFSDTCGFNSYIFSLMSEHYDTILIPNTLERTYFITDNCGNQELCVQKISIENTTQSTDYELDKKLKIKIFPNPTNGKFIFEAEGLTQKEVSMSIFNSIGARIAQDKFIPVNGQLKKEMDLSDVAKGIYYIKILDGKSSETQSIIVE